MSGDKPTPPEIIHWPQECFSDCDDPDCPYTHGDSWEVRGINTTFYSEQAATRAATAKAMMERGK